jgi:hypothetical protein
MTPWMPLVDALGHLIEFAAAILTLAAVVIDRMNHPNDDL